MSAEFMDFGRSLEALNEPVRELLRSLTGLEEGETGQLFVDRARWLRLEQAAEIVERARIQLERAGAEPRKVAPKVLVAILEGASLEDDEDLRDMWAGMLASAAAGSPLGVQYPKLLAEMGSDEVRILETACNAPLDTGIADGERLRSRLSMPENRYHVAMDNLFRLRLFIPLVPDRARPAAQYLNPCLTPTGVQLMKVCRGPSTPPNEKAASF